MRAAPALATLIAAFGLIAAAPRPVPGSEGAACAPDEAGPALKLTLVGLKDRKGVVRVELYPDNDKDFLADDTTLIAEGKVFRRVMTPMPAQGPVEVCIRAPRPDRYAVAVIHDRKGGGLTFSPFADGVGFPGDPKLALAKPRARQVAIDIGPGVTTATATLNYWSGGLSFGPIRRR